MQKLLLKDLSLENQKVLMRVDYNVPLNKDGTISDDTRIRESLPSIQYILNHGGSVILMSHLGRPEGKPNLKYTLAPCAKRLSELLQQEVFFANDCIGQEAIDKAANLKKGQILMLENLRFYPEEEKPSLNLSFAKRLASLGTCFVSDGFGVAHRSHSSVTEIAKYFPTKSAAGLLMEKEIFHLHNLFNNPKRPFYAIIGGSKISTKIGVLESLIDKVDALFIGGGMAYTFLKAEGIAIGDSICEDSQIEMARKLKAKCIEKEVPLYLPQDVVTTREFSNEADQKTFDAHQGIENGWQGMDIGPKTCTLWDTVLSQAKTIFWNGPLGVFEFKNFAKGTEHIAKTLAQISATTIVGGGDSVAAIQNFNLTNKFSHLSTGGGASLEYIENGNLPGIDALTNK